MILCALTATGKHKLLIVGVDCLHIIGTLSSSEIEDVSSVHTTGGCLDRFLIGVRHCSVFRPFRVVILCIRGADRL